MNEKIKIRMSTMRIVAMGFLGVILAGGIFLWLPFSNQTPISFIDALFTSASAVCVTGLVTITPATQFTIVGKVILLLLIQIGGLGVIACVTAFFLVARKRISLRERNIIREAYGMGTMTGMVAMIIRILKVTLGIEGIGALGYALQFIPEYGLEKGICYSIFHSVSTFCNAGIDILGSSSYIEYVRNPIINLTAMFLIVVSGLGFPFWHEVHMLCKRVWKKEIRLRQFFWRLSIHAKLVIVTTLFLIVAGAAVILALEYHNEHTLGALPFGDKVMASFFQSVTTRTAGFCTISQEDFRPASLFICCILMFIGGSPAGTAGGVKTTTIAMMLLCTRSVVRGERDVECFGRKISSSLIHTGLGLILIALNTVVIGTILLSVFQPEIPFLSSMFEVFSAFGTVGLSAGVTGSLRRAAKIVIIIIMYIGRIGPITLALAVGAKKFPKNSVRTLPEENILLG